MWQQSTVLHLSMSLTEPGCSLCCFPRSCKQFPLYILFIFCESQGNTLFVPEAVVSQKDLDFFWSAWSIKQGAASSGRISPGLFLQWLNLQMFTLCNSPSWSINILQSTRDSEAFPGMKQNNHYHLHLELK